MGVPKFFRYISERYPCLSQLILECEIPEFDNFYLDMNGIIHNCSHPNDYDPHFRISEEKIFKDIFNYIEALFRIIKPQKLFFMAVDGVAPRAKMNQQRGRRFRSAKETEDRDKDVVRRGGKLPDSQKFDSNCITPGTSFMAKLQAQLKFFVANKISTDKNWQKVKIILSGHECPGEGEHKIMDYIRYMRSHPDYDPNTRHCLYGLDADLIMLGLCTHEPHFALLREEVKFGRKQSKKILAPEEIKFFLLHLSLLREYLEMEFWSLKDALPFGFNLENIIDDWVLMGFLVGNDFIPHLPGMHISSGALSALYKAYYEVLPTLDGYLNEGGKLNLARFEMYMKKLASFDIKQYREMYDDLKYLKSKSSGVQKKGSLKESQIGFKSALQPYFADGEEIVEEELGGVKRCVKILDDEHKDPGSGGEDDSGDEYVDMDKAVNDLMNLDESDGSEYYDEDDKEADRLAFFQEFCLHKKVYYQEKLEYKRITPGVLRSQAEGYIKAIQWNLHYYYNGLCSWSWYYPHHYAPYMSDIQNFKDMQIDFELGEPFLPFQQLLAVLPSFSKDLLPKPFQELMTDEKSPIFDYYPLNFDTDLNGKKNEWEAVVLIPFIDEDRLLKSMESCYHRLTDEEKERNKHGPMHVYTYTKEDLGRLEAPAYFAAIERNHALDIPLYREQILVPHGKLRKGLLRGALAGVYFPGFPTFKNLEYSCALQPEGVKVFQSSSQGLNMIVKVIAPEKKPDHEQVFEELLNQVVHVNWPYLSEACVVGIKSSTKETILEGGACRNVTSDKDDKFTSEVQSASQDLLKSRGIDVGPTDILVKVRAFEGQKFTFNSTTPGGEVKIQLEKKWSNNMRYVPLQVVIKDTSSTHHLNPDVTLDDIFPEGRNCFLLNPKHYGCLGVVNGKAEDSCVRVRITVPPEPEPEDLNIHQSDLYYYSNNEAAQRARIPSHLLARITGTILVLDTNDPLMMDKAPKVNIGLNLKFSRRNQQLPGFTRRTESNQWLYSDKTIKLLREYADTFPEVIRYLAKNSDKDNIFKNDMFPLPGQAHMLNVISNWLDSKAELKAERRSCEAELLEPDEIAELETRVEQFMKKNKRGRFVNLKVKPFHLFLPSSLVEKVGPDNADFKLLDRVVNIRDNFVIPLGQRGTIIGLEKQLDYSSIIQCDILFDQPLNAATQYHTKKKRVYKIPDKCLLNITHAKDKFAREEASRRTALYQKQAKAMPDNVQSMAPIKALLNNVKPLSSNNDSSATLMNPVNRPYAAVAAIPVSSFMNHFAHHPAANIPAQNTVVLPATSGPIVTSREIENRTLRMCRPSAHDVQIEEAISSEDSKEPTNTLKKLLKISDMGINEAAETLPPAQDAQMLTVAEIERGNAAKDYIIELQEIFMKLGQPNPHYEYEHSNGSICATLFLPNIEIGVIGDPASSKKFAAERAAFLVLQQFGLVRQFGDRVAPVEVNERSLRELYTRIGVLKKQLADLHRTQTPLQLQQQHQQQPHPSAPPQPQQPYSQPLPMMGVPTYAQFPPLQQVPTVSMTQQQAPLPFNPSLVRPTPQFPGYVAPILQQRPVGLATNYLFQQPLMPPQQRYYQQLSYRAAFPVNNPIPNVSTAATYAVSGAPNVVMPQYAQTAAVVANNVNGAAGQVVMNNMPRVRLTQGALAKNQIPTSINEIFSNACNSQVNVRPASGFTRGGGGVGAIFSRTVGNVGPRQQIVRAFFDDRQSATAAQQETDTTASSTQLFSPITQDSSFTAATSASASCLSETNIVTRSVSAMGNNQEDLSFSSGRMSKTPRKNRLAANFATKPSV